MPGVRTRPALTSAALVLVLVISLVSFVHRADGYSGDFASRYAAGVAVADHANPYSTTALGPLEAALPGPALRAFFAFRDAPPVAQGFRVLAVVPFRVAVYLWLAVILLAAFVTVLLTTRLVGLRPREWTDYLVVAAIAVTFSPLRGGLSVDQLDPATCALTLLGVYIALRHRIGGGLLQAVAILKPQGTLFASTGACWGAARRFCISALIALACLFLISLGLSAVGLPVGWVSWLHALRSASQQKHPHSLAEIVLLVPITVALAIRAWRAAPESVEQRMIWSFAIAAAVNGALAPLVFLHLHSDVLLCVPAAIVARSIVHRRDATRDQIAFGIALGVLFVDGLFPVVHYSGVTHAALPAVLATLMVLAAAVRFPSLRLSLAVALVVNYLVTVPPVGETLPVWFSVVGSLLLLALLPDSPLHTVVSIEDQNYDHPRAAESGNGAGGGHVCSRDRAGLGSGR